MGRGLRKNGGKMLGYNLRWTRFLPVKLPNSTFDNVLPWVLPFWVSDIPSFMGFGWRGLLPLSKEVFFPQFQLNHPNGLPREPSCPALLPPSVTETLLLDFMFYLHPSRLASSLSLKGLGGENTSLRITCVSLSQASDWGSKDGSWQWSPLYLTWSLGVMERSGPKPCAGDFPSFLLQPF